MKTLKLENTEWALILDLLKLEQKRLNCAEKNHLEYYFKLNFTIDEIENLFNSK